MGKAAKGLNFLQVGKKQSTSKDISVSQLCSSTMFSVRRKQLLEPLLEMQVSFFLLKFFCLQEQKWEHLNFLICLRLVLVIFRECAS